MNCQIVNQLKALKPILKEEYGIEEFAVFGSVAKGLDTETSDVDIAILKDSKKSFFLLLKAKKFLEEQLNRNIDIGDFDSMKTFVKNRIKKDFIYV
ncbi:MAG: nucleotidyltransferase domain-containing protein [Sulfurimonas sp.]|jgi:hypothetical protein